MKRALLLFAVLVCLAGSASGQGARIDNYALLNTGSFVKVAAGAIVTVCTSAGSGQPCTPLATTYTSVTLGSPTTNTTPGLAAPCGQSPTTNPCTADSNGNFGFWVSPGPTYITTITGAGVTAATYTITGTLTGPGNNAFTGAPGISETNAGVFTNTQMNEYVTSLLNGFSPAASMHVDPLYTSFFNTEALTGGLTVPVGATVINGIGVAGYADSLCDSASRTKCNASAGFFRALARGNNSAVWGVNPQAADVPGLTGHSLTGNEIDVGVYGSPAFVRGLDIILAAGQNSYGVMPANSIGIEIFTGAAGGLQWNKAISVDRGSSLNGQGLVLDGKLLTNPTSSISAAFLGYDSGGVAHQSSINGDSAGNLILQPALGVAYSINNSAGGIGMPKGAFSGLTACSGTNEGTIAAVTDSTTNTWGATITGAGANHVLAYCDGTNWTVAGK